MGLVGISLIVASLVCLYMYPQAWRELVSPFLQWRQPAQIAEARTEDDKDEKNKDEQDGSTQAAEPSKTAGQSTSNGRASAAATSKAERDRAAMPPPPPIIRTSAGKAAAEDEDEEEATTPKAVPATSGSSAIPTLSLSAPGDDDDDEDDDTDRMPPPMFPSPFSAQRAGASADPSRAAPAPSLSAPGLMAPPPLPQPRRLLPSLNPPSSSTLNPPRRPATLPVPNRGPPRGLSAGLLPSSSSSLAPPPSSTTKPAKPARKVVLAPGHSPLDWARLTADPAGNNLRGQLPADAPYLLRVTPSQLKTMNGRKGRDAWTALGGMVYNITPYVPFHPGGAGELLRCAGRDGNKLFNDVHSWVNYDNMLSACRIGILVEEHAARTSPMEEMD